MINITSIYKQLFGANGPHPGNVIDMAEHGRAGGQSDQQGFKYTNSVDETMLIDEASSTVTYIGWSYPGSNRKAGKADARWKIKKIDSTSIPTQIHYADGNDSYDNVWNDRSGLSYS